jgi:hypothetical protein
VQDEEKKETDQVCDFGEQFGRIEKAEMSKEIKLEDFISNELHNHTYYTGKPIIVQQ